MPGLDVPSGWIQVSPGATSEVSTVANGQGSPPHDPQERVSGRWRQARSAKGAPQVGLKPRINPNVARETALTKVSRLERALEAIGNLQGPVVAVLKADLMKARAASTKPSVDVEVDELRYFISRVERRIKELDTEHENDRSSLVEAQERLDRLWDEQSRCSTTHDVLMDLGPQVTALQQMVHLLESERDVLSKKLQSVRFFRFRRSKPFGQWLRSRRSHARDHGVGMRMGGFR